MKAIIFGANGQDGYFLNQLLISKNIETFLVSRSGNCIIGDVADLDFVQSLIKKHKPHYIFHFAAVSSTRHNVLFDNYRAICEGTNNILESVRLESLETKVFLSGSAMQFENNGTPINETTPFAASSPYSVARIYSVYCGRYYRKAFNLKTYVGYFFNHDSQLRSESHVNQKIVRAVQRIAKGDKEILEIGNVDVRKEFNYAGDAVEAIWQLVNQDTITEAVIGSGEVHSIRDWIKYCFGLINRNWEDHVVVKDNFTPEYDVLVSDPKVLYSLGWAPKVNFTGLAELMLFHPSDQR